MSSFFDEFVDNAPTEPPEDGERDRSILAVDVGTTTTRAMLIEPIEGMYQFVSYGEAPSTYNEPWDNALAGLSDALKQITTTTTRALIEAEDQLIIPQQDDYVGVDRLTVTMSGGKPITAMVVGLMPRVSVQSAVRALSNIYVDVIDTYSLVDPRGPEEFFNRIVSARPDLIAITGGTNGGTVNALRKRIDLVATACASLQPQARPMILYAGNQEQLDYVRDIFEDVGVKLVNGKNPRPELTREDIAGLTQDLVALFNDYHLRHTPGYRTLERWSDGALFPSTQGFGQLIEVLGHLDGENVLGIDVGSQATTLAAYIDGEAILRTYTDLGVGMAAHRTLERIGPEAVLSWAIAQELTTEAVQENFWNRALYPHTIPVTPSQRDMEYGLVREILREAFDRFPWGNSIPNFDTILLTGSVFTRAPSPALAVMTVLDMLGPNGYTRFLSDPYGIASVMGLLSTVHVRAFVQVLDTGAFVEMAQVFSTRGKGRENQTVLKGTITLPEGNTTPFEAKGNSLTIMPFGSGLKGTVELETSGVKLDMPKQDGKYRREITGSEAGVLLDTRSTPITLPKEEAVRRQRLLTWLQSVYTLPELEPTP